MADFIIDNGVIIDDIDSVVESIAKLSGMSIPDPLTIKRFVTNEKSTKFYIDNKCACKMQPDRDTAYLWLDSGFTDYCGEPIMISLLSDKRGGYCGHVCGTMRSIANSVAGYFSQNRKYINRNISVFREKYNNKISGREHSHIEDEQEYLIMSSNGESGNNIMAQLIGKLDIKFESSATEIAPEAEAEASKKEENNDISELPSMNELEEQITIDLLIEHAKKQEEYIDKLLGIIEKFNKEDKARMRELEEENAKYKKAFVDIRTHFEENAGNVTVKCNTALGGHTLLGERSRILVLGECALDEKTMNGIAKTYGFERRDFEYETDYDKVMNYAGRLSYGQRYAAVILGACPHKVNLLGDYNSFIEKCKADENLPNAYDARTRSGELKVTKESFRRTLEKLISDMREKEAVKIIERFA